MAEDVNSLGFSASQFNKSSFDIRFISFTSSCLIVNSSIVLSIFAINRWLKYFLFWFVDFINCLGHNL